MKPLLIPFLLLGLVGCSAATSSQAPLIPGSDSLQSTAPCCSTLAQLNYRPITGPGKIEFKITEQSQAFQFETGKSFVQGFKLPATDGVIKLEVVAPMRASVFAPMLLVLDQDHQPIELYDDTTFPYQKAGFVHPDRFQGELQLIQGSGASATPSYLVFLTSDELMQQMTQPGTLDTRVDRLSASRSAMQELENPPVPHAAIGDLELKVDYSAPASKGAAAAAVVAAPATATAVEPASEAISPETEAMFIKMIDDAMAEGNTAQAERFVREAEKAGSTRARSYYENWAP